MESNEKEERPTAPVVPGKSTGEGSASKERTDSMGTPAYTSTGKVGGTVRGDTLHCYAKKGHMLRRPPAWAKDIVTLEQALACGASVIAIHHEGTVYSVAIATMFERGFRFNRGYGEQIALPLAHWMSRPDEDARS